jgi:hypothetical protein
MWPISRSKPAYAISKRDSNRALAPIERYVRKHPEERRVFAALTLGGLASADQLLEQVDELRELWSARDVGDDAIRHIVRVFGMAIQVRWAWAHASARGLDFRTEWSLWVPHSSRWLVACGVRDPYAAHEEWYAIAKQYWHHAIHGEASRSLDAELVLSLAAQGLGRELSVPLDEHWEPVSDWMELCGRGWQRFLGYGSSVTAPLIFEMVAPLAGRQLAA